MRLTTSVNVLTESFYFCRNYTEQRICLINALVLTGRNFRYLQHQWCGQGQNLKTKASTLKSKAKAWTFEAKAWTFEAKAWTFEAKAWTLDAKAWTFEAKAWTFEAKAWTFEATAWTFEAKAWTLDAKPQLSTLKAIGPDILAKAFKHTAKA